MPASHSNSWFITISPTDYDQIDEKMVVTLSSCSVSSHVVIEKGSLQNHSHVHAYVEYPKVESQEVVRRRWAKCLPKDVNLKVALKVVVVTDRDRLIGQYLSKEEEVVILHSSISPDELASLKGAYKKINDIKDKGRLKYKYLTLATSPDVIIAYAKSNDMPLNGQLDFKDVTNSMVRNGFRLTCIMGRLKYVWAEIQVITGQSVDFLYV